MKIKQIIREHLANKLHVMKYFIATIFILICLKSLSQGGKKESTFEVFQNGYCEKNNQKIGQTCLKFIFKSDSTFISVLFQHKNLVKKIAYGTYVSLKKDSVKLNFKNYFSPILDISEITYSSKSAPPYDSIFIRGKVIIDKNDPFKRPSILFSDKFGMESNDSGYFFGSFPRVKKNNTIVLKKNSEYYNPVVINLLETSNIHEVTIKLSIKDSTNCEIIKGYLGETVFSEFALRSYNKKSTKGLRYLSNNIEDIKQELINAKKIQPMLITNIDEILKFLEN